MGHVWNVFDLLLSLVGGIAVGRWIGRKLVVWRYGRRADLETQLTDHELRASQIRCELENLP